MAKIIQMNTYQTKYEAANPIAGECLHKSVIAYKAARIIQCTLCGKLIDPFDVLADLIQGRPENCK